MIIIDELPFSHIEKEGFKSFYGEMQPKFHVISRTTVTKDVIGIFNEEKKKLKEHMKELSERDWKLQKKIINFRVLLHPHKGEAIANAVENCLLEWGIEKVMTITLDNAKNNDTCAAELKKRLNKCNGLLLLLGGEFFHIRCFAHIINLVVRDGINEVKGTIKRLRRSVKYVRSGPSHVKTRWNSTYLMIDSALEFEKVFDRLEKHDLNYKIECDVKGEGLLGDSDWRKLKALHTFLEEFYKLTKWVSGSKYVTSNTYFDELTQAKDLLIDNLTNDDVDFCEMAMKMDAKFDKYCNFDSLNLILVVAIILDPRYKMKYVEFWYSAYVEKVSHLSEEEKYGQVVGFIKKLKDLMSRLYNHYKLEDASIRGVNAFSTQELIINSAKNASKCLKAKELFRGILKQKDNMDALNDLERYLGDGLVKNDDCLDVLGRWHEKVSTYHALAIMAREVLSIPVTSVAFECTFSTAGRILDPFRSSLTPIIVESLICSQDWLRNLIPEEISVEEKLENLEEIEKVVFNEMRSLVLGSTS
ncbi:hypothetical protein GIB67_036348 [Kingdonia uniflora]|uniref:Transposase n=1 Tax=Kingdonia uniflora TaxID=39325 RepID=A0A7J7L3U9_9MAGN|nr:hypothetical protein GIB67_036348 [Kingdonia uniflora]